MIYIYNIIAPYSMTSCAILALENNQLSDFVPWEGVWKKNNRLLSSRITNIGNFISGPETIVTRPSFYDSEFPGGEPEVYASDADRIVRIINDDAIEEFVSFCDCIVLGIAFQNNIYMWAAVVGVYDSSLGGIYMINMETRSKSKIIYDIFPNSLAFMGEYLYYSHSTDRELCNGDPVRTLTFEFIRGARNGKLCRFKFRDENPIVEDLITDIFVANGVTTLSKQGVVLVASMFDKVIFGYNIYEKKAFIWSEIMPGYIDNIVYDKKTESVLAALVQPQISKFLTFFYKYIPYVRYLFNFLPSPEQKFGGVAVVSAETAFGRSEGITDIFLNDKDGSVITNITHASRVGSQLFLGGFHNYIARFGFY